MEYTGEEPEADLAEYEEFSEMPLPDDVVGLEVFDAEAFPNGSINYWLTFETSAASAEALCAHIGNFFNSTREELHEIPAKSLRVSQEFLDSHEGEVRHCGARMDNHHGGAAIFYPGADDAGTAENVTVYLNESSIGW